MAAKKSLTAIACVLMVLALGMCIYALGPRSVRISVPTGQENVSREKLQTVEVRSPEGYSVEARIKLDVHSFNEDSSGVRSGVKGAPFSAQIAITRTQTLANGSHITENSTGAVARDSDGRTRFEEPRDGAPEIVMISDPVASMLYHVHMFQHTVVKVQLNSGSEPTSSEQRVHAEREVAERARARAERERAQADSTNQKETVRTESLGTQTIEGVQVVGKRRTVTIAAGAQGNDQPMDIVSESWYSPELQQVIMSKHSDPRSGDTIYRLTNINRSEPPHSSFEVPAEFSVKEEGAEGWKK